MKTKRTRWWLKSAALLCATVFGLTAFGYDDGGRYIAETETFSEPTSIQGDVWIGNNNTGVFTESQSFVWASSDGDNAGATLTGWLRVADWGGTEAQPLYGNLDIQSGTYTAGGLQVGGSTPDYTYAWATLSGGKLTVSTVNVGSTGENAGTATLTLNGGTLSTTSVTGTGTLVVGENGGTFGNAEAATIATALTGSGTLTKTGEGTLAITGDISAFKGKIAVAEGAGSVTIGKTTIVAGQEVQFGVYTWTGAGTKTTTTTTDPDTGDEVTTTTCADADLWSNVNNWLVNGSIPATAPAADSTVVIPAGDGELTIRISGSSDCTGFLTINRDVKFVRPNSGTNGWGIRVSKVEGTGKLTLAGNNRGTPLVYDWLHIYTGQATDGEIIIDTDLQVEAYVQLDGTTPLRVNGAFSGGARFTCYSSDGQQGVHFHGDTSGFTGSYTGGTRASGSRDGTEFYGSALGSASGSWTFGGEFSKNAGYSPLNAGNGVTYEFGQLTTIFDGYNRLTFETYHKSSNSDYASNVTLKIGGRANSTSNVGGAINGTNNKIEKVGATSTLNLTLTETAGTVEAKEGVTVLKGTVAPAALNFTGTGATAKVASTVGTYETQTVVVTPAVEDNPETEEDESADAVTEEQQVMTAAFVPGIDSSLAGCQFATTTETIDNVEYTVYTIADVAKDANEVAYKTVALAIAALADAENKTITLTANTTEAIALPFGYTLVMNGCTASVSGAAGVAVSYDEETQTYTTVKNAAATWTGAVNNWWHEAGNWSTGYVPNEGTDVTFENTATVWIYDYSGDNGDSLHKCKDINIGKCTVTLRFPDDGNSTQGNSWPRLDVYGNIVGTDSKTNLKLFRCGIRNMKGSGIGISKCHVVYENDGEHDSWLEGGDFTFSDFGVSGTGFLRLLDGTYTFSGGAYCGIEILEGSTVECTKAPHFSHEEETLTGSGRIVIHNLSTLAARFQNALKNAERWSGTCELAGVSFNKINAANFGNVNSTVCFNGVTGYPDFGSDQTEKDIGAVKVIELGANGLTLNDKLSKKYFTISAKLTGSGPIHIATKCDNKDQGKLSYYSFTGDVSEFTGAVDYGTLSSYRPIIVFRNSDEALPTDAVTDYGQIIVTEGKTVNVASTWFGAGGWIINGTVNVASTGALTCDSNGQLIGGSGTVRFAAAPATAPRLSSSAWTGVAVADFALTSGANCELNSLGTVNSVVANGQAFTGHLNGNYVMVPALRLDNDFTFNNGSSSTTVWPDGKITKFARILGEKNLNITWDNPNTGAVAYYEVEKVDGSYTGTINVSAKSALRIDEVALDAAPEAGVRIVKLAVTSGGSVVNADTDSVLDGATVALTVGGEASEAKAVYAADGLYVAVAKVGENYYASYEAAAAAAEEAAGEEDTPSFTVVYGDGALNGWDYDSESNTLTRNSNVARIGTTEYATLSAAIKAASAGDTVVLFRDSDENAALTAGGWTLEIDTTAYTGMISGDGTVVANVAFMPVFGEWTGTFVMNWDTSAATSGTAWVFDNYGNAGSTVVIAQPIAHGYLKATGSGTTPSIAPAVYLKANVYIDNGYAKGTGETAPVTTFSQLGADEGVTLSFRYLANAAAKDATYYTITKLKDFAGAFVLNPYNQVTVESVELAQTPAFGTKVVSAAVDATASLTGLIAEGYPLVLKDDGLYFDPVAQVGTAYYNTLAEAITAANGATVVLVKSTDEAVEVAAGQTVVIQFGDYSTGEIAAAADYILNTSWDDATKTGTYTCTAVAGTEADDGSGNKFTVPATVATPADKTLTDAATGTINYAQAYALGLWDGTAEGAVAEPTVSINIVDGKVQVAFAGGTVPEAYTVTTILQYKTTLGTTSEWQNVEGATGALGATLTDSSEMGANKFYRVIVTITNK